MSVLKNHYSKLSKYIEAAAKLLGFDIYLVDSNRLRVMGTGIYSKMLGIVLPEHTSNGWVLEHQKPLSMLEPTTHEVCTQCPMNQSDNCGKEYSIHMPIFVEAACVGVVTISSGYDRESKTRMRLEKEALEGHCAVLADAISGYLMHALQRDAFNQLVTHMRGTVVVAELDGRIVRGSGAFHHSFKSGNIYDVIPKGSETYGANFSEARIHLSDEHPISVKRVPVEGPVGNGRQLFILEPEGNVSESTYPLENALHLAQIVGESAHIERLKSLAAHASKYKSNCLITGESGTGKEVFARLIHNLSDRRDRPFVCINCAAIPANLLESEMFGYESGAFTGANQKGKMGLFESANGGTVFLDEIGDLSLHLQPKLLRAIETERIQRVGGTDEIQLDVRFIAATHIDLGQKMASGAFRSDLYYRLCVIPIDILPLRERMEDLIGLCGYFIEKYNVAFNKSVKGLSPDVKRAFFIHNWEGNVRELENVIEYAMTMTHGAYLEPESLPPSLQALESVKVKGRETLSTVKSREVLAALDHYGRTAEGKQHAAKALGISLSTLYRYIKRYALK